MSCKRICIRWLVQSLRNISLLKLILLGILSLLVIVYILFFHQKNTLCNPAEHLQWFCPWPDPQSTVCSWNEHFPSLERQRRTPQSSEQLLLSLPKRRSSFHYNNKTFIKCQEDSIDLLIFIISKCSHASIRQSIRRTWANTNYLETIFRPMKLKLLFLVDVDTKSEQKIVLESQYHHDIVQISTLPEQYEYVTDREAALYQFILQHCQQTKYLFKTDDDIFINTFLLLSFLQQYSNANQYILYGFPIEHGLVIRHTKDNVAQRYIITNDEYACPRYPTFLSGFGYLVSYESCSLIYNAYLTDIKPFPLSDVYFTGLIAHMFNIQRQSLFPNIDYLYERGCDEEYFRSNTKSFACAASNDHFNAKESSGDRNLMNGYNLYWTILTERYTNAKINEK